MQREEGRFDEKKIEFEKFSETTQISLGEKMEQHIFFYNCHFRKS